MTTRTTKPNGPREQPESPDPLYQLVKEGKARHRPPSGSGPLPTMKLLKPVPDLQRIIRESKKS